jgi:uncharacterized membrane protein
MMTLIRWLRRPAQSARRATAHSRPPTARPMLEALEDRLTPSGYKFSTINPPGSNETSTSGINASGQVVGWYVDAGNVGHGFLLSKGVYTTIDPPGSTDTQIWGINDPGQIVGDYMDGSGIDHGFLLSRGAYTTLDGPGGATITQAYSINNRGQIVGSYEVGVGPVHGFLLSGGSLTTLDPPGSTFTYAAGINNAGQIVGYYVAADVGQGFLLSKGVYTTFDVPGATSFPPIVAGGFAYGTGGNNITDSGQIVGYYYDASGTSHGFLLSGGTYTTIDVPGGATTFAYGINARGDIVGIYLNADGVYLGFLATPNP